jgi:hypothetical protein
LIRSTFRFFGASWTACATCCARSAGFLPPGLQPRPPGDGPGRRPPNGEDREDDDREPEGDDRPILPPAPELLEWPDWTQLLLIVVAIIIVIIVLWPEMIAVGVEELASLAALLEDAFEAIERAFEGAERAFERAFT